MGKHYKTVSGQILVPWVESITFFKATNKTQKIIAPKI